MFRQFVKAAAIAAVVIGAASAAHAQNTNRNRNNNNNSSASSASNTTTIAIDAAAIAGGMPGMGGALGAGAGGAGAGGVVAGSLGSWANPQFILGGTTAASPPSTFNDCGNGWSMTVGPIGGGASTESAACVGLREGMASGRPELQPGTPGYERMCIASPSWKQMDERTARVCYEVRAADAEKAAKGQQAPAVQRVSAPVVVTPPPPVTVGRQVCLDVAGREVPPGTPGASCGGI